MIKIPLYKPPDLFDLQYIESEFKTCFSFKPNVMLCVSFQRFNSDWEEFVDLESSGIIYHRDKLKAVVSPILVESIKSSIISETLEEETPILDNPVWNSTPVTSTVNDSTEK